MTKDKTGSAHELFIAGAVVVGVIIGAIFGPVVMPSSVTAPQAASTAVADMSNAEQLAWAEQLLQDDLAIRLLGDRPIIGNKDAELAIVEFSDLQCPYCRRLGLTTFPDIKKEYIDTGKVKYVFRHFVLDSHPGAMPAAHAAECARDQDLFLEAVAHIFRQQEDVAPGQTVGFEAADVSDWMRELDGLDFTTWETCFDSGKYIDMIQKDTQAGMEFGVRGTPTVFVDGEPVTGAQPFPVFSKLIENALIK